jgi:hypothetical protein
MFNRISPTSVLLAIILLGSAVATSAPALRAAPAAAPSAEEAAYTETINARADKIVATLAIADAPKALRIRDQIAGQYRNLRTIHEERDQLKKSAPSSAAANNDLIMAKLSQLHRAYVSRLSVELSPEQVDAIKDGMTYGVAPLTFRVYQEMLPDLTAEQKIQIHAWLIEAREYAMDAGSSGEKHGWFGKYKGRINNYLSAAGINMKDAEKAAAARRQSTAKKH